MKALEKLGEWVLDAGWMWFACALLIGIFGVSFGVSLYSCNHTVQIPDTQFECTATDAVGIKARCTQYTMKGLTKSLANREE